MNKALLYSLLALLLVPLALRAPGVIIIPFLNMAAGATDYGNNTVFGEDVNALQGIEAVNYFRNGVNLFDILPGYIPNEVDIDANAIGVCSSWFPVQDGNLWRYIPSEADIDRNAIAWDTNTQTACDGNFVATGGGSCIDISNFYITGTGTDTDTIRTYTGTNPIKVDNDANTIGTIADFNKQYWNKFGTDLNAIIDVRAKAQDTNANTVCDGNTVLTGNGICQGITGFDIIETGGTTPLALPWQDANLWRYIPNETDIDRNCTALDTNIFMSGVSDCAANNYVYGFNSNGTLDCRADTGGTTPLALPWQDANLWRYIPNEQDIDRNAIAWDSNTQTACDGNFVATGGGECIDISNFYITGTGTDTDTIRTYTSLNPIKIDNDANTVGVITDMNKWFWSKFGTDLNATIDVRAKAQDTNIFISGVSDCAANNYVYGFNTNGTLDCRVDTGGTTPLALPWQDANLWRYIPAEADIDANAIGVCSAWFPVVDANVADDITLNTTKDVNASKGIKAENFFGGGSGLTGVTASTNWADVNAHLVPYVSATKDVNLNFHDVNARSIKVGGIFGNTASFFNDLNLSKGIKATGFFGTTLDLTGNFNGTTATCTADVNFSKGAMAVDFFGSGKSLTGVQKTADANNFFSQISTTYSRVDVNQQFIPAVGTIKDLNMGTKDINTYGKIQVGPFRIDYNGTHLVIGT